MSPLNSPFAEAMAKVALVATVCLLQLPTATAVLAMGEDDDEEYADVDGDGDGDVTPAAREVWLVTNTWSVLH